MSKSHISGRTTRSSAESKQIEIIDLTSSPTNASTSAPRSRLPNPQELPSPITLKLRRSQIKLTHPITIHDPSDGSQLPYLSKSSLQLLRKKQAKLSNTAQVTSGALSTIASPVPRSSHNSPLLSALLSTLIFASEEAGTAVMIHSDGWVLTCAHCFAESKEDWDGICQADAKYLAKISKKENLSQRKQQNLGSDNDKRKWLLFYNGDAACVECTIWDGRRDLALCRIIGIESPSTISNSFSEDAAIHFTSLQLSAKPTKLNSRVVCIGQPGAEDLESEIPNTKTKYNLIEISSGRYRGLIPSHDFNDNEDIGSLKHDAWTYWGHSGAPLVSFDVEKEGVRLIGLHSSWDDQTAMRHGVPGEAIREFMKECGDIVGVDFSFNET